MTGAKSGWLCGPHRLLFQTQGNTTLAEGVGLHNSIRCKLSPPRRLLPCFRGDLLLVAFPMPRSLGPGVFSRPILNFCLSYSRMIARGFDQPFEMSETANPPLQK